MQEYLQQEIDWRDPMFAATYDEMPLWSAYAGALLLKHVPLRRGARLLDVGCGTGFPLIELAQRLGPETRAVGLDPWEAALERARLKAAWLRLPRVELVVGQAESMPFPDASFDLVVSNLGLNNFAEPRAALRECRRLLAPAGTLALVTNPEGHFAEFYAVFADVLRALGEQEAEARLQEHIAHRTSLAGTVRLLAEAGLVARSTQLEHYRMRFADGTSLLHHAFIRVAFLGGWRAVLPRPTESAVFSALEAALNAKAAAAGHLELTVPLAYVECRPG